ncbi:MAG: hypothetical protein QXU40_00075 [Candidatus Pacearchaeota archaeon]
MIRTILFDCGGVLIEDPIRDLFKYCAMKLRVSEEDFERAFLLYFERFQRGKILESDLWQMFVKFLKPSLPRLNHYGRMLS